MSSLGDQVRTWHWGVQAVARGDWPGALRLFSEVPGPAARMSFNVGCVHLLAGDPEAALRAFDQAVTKDACLAVGFLQRGVASFQLKRFQEALSDFRLALVQLRGNPTIDYTQLGLRFRLQAWEVLYNVAAAQSQLGLWSEAASSLREAVSKWPEGAHSGLDTALDQVQKQTPLQPRQVPRGEVFRPHRRHLEHLEPVDFLGKAKVVASDEDPRPGVQPQQPEGLGADGEASPRASARARVTEPPRAAACHGPTDADTGASPSPAGQADRGSVLARQEQGAAVGDPESLVMVTVQCAFTVALRAQRGADLSSLRALLAQALPHQAQLGQLSCQAAGDARSWVPIYGEESLQRAWQASGGGGLQLQCRGAGGRPILYQVVAQHRYAAQGPEDLDLQPGDTVDVLCEVDEAWLEGHCEGRIGIFPKCFVAPAGGRL